MGSMLVLSCISKKSDFATLIDAFERDYYNRHKTGDTEFDSIMSTSPMFLTCIFYSWNDSLRMTVWGDYRPILIRNDYLKGLSYHGNDCIFVYLVGECQDSIALISELELEKGLLSFDSKYSQIDYLVPYFQDDYHMMYSWEGDPYKHEYVYENESWILKGMGFGLTKCLKRMKEIEVDGKENELY